jgi:hypothetical protein
VGGGGEASPLPVRRLEGSWGEEEEGGQDRDGGGGGQRDERHPAGINKGVAPVKGGTQQSNRNNKSQRRQRTAGIVASRNGVDTPTPANKRRCRNERHWEEEEVADAMATTEEDAVAVAVAMAVSFSSTLNSIPSNSYFPDYRTIQIETSQIE